MPLETKFFQLTGKERRTPCNPRGHCQKGSTGGLAKEMDEFNNEEETMKKVIMLFAIIVVLALATGSSLGSEDHDYHHDYHHESGHEDGYESRFYGTITNIPANPPNYTGIWIVTNNEKLNKEVQVTEKTHFSEKHGKVEVGAYVEVEGRNVGNVFEAYEIEVKRAKK